MTTLKKFASLSTAFLISGWLMADITVYNGQHKEFIEALVKEFTKKTGIKVTLNSAKDAQLAGQIMEEGAKSPADVFVAEYDGALSGLSDAGLLTKLSKKIINSTAGAGVPKAQKSDWVALSGRARVVAYDSSKLKSSDLPKKLLDFESNKWNGKLGYVPTSGAFVEQVIAISKLNGDDVALKWLKWLKDNGKRYAKNSVALQAVENGEIQVALINNYYWNALERERGLDKIKSRLHFTQKGDVGSLLVFSAAGVLKSSKNQKEARKFVEFMVSKQGQSVLAMARAEYPLRKNVKSGFGLARFETLGSPEVTQTSKKDVEHIQSLMQEAGLK